MTATQKLNKLLSNIHAILDGNYWHEYIHEDGDSYSTLGNSEVIIAERAYTFEAPDTFKMTEHGSMTLLNFAEKIDHLYNH